MGLRRTLFKGQIIHGGMDGMWLADGMLWRQLDAKLLLASLLLDVSSCTEAGPDVAVVFKEEAAWRRIRWTCFFCAFDVAAGAAGIPAASSCNPAGQCK